MRKIFTLLIVAILATATSWAATNTYQHVFESKPSTGNNVMLSNVGWNISGTNIGGFQNSYAGVQLGTSKKNGQITLTSPSAWTYKGGTKITEVRLWLNLGGTSITPTVTIGGKVAKSTGKVVKNTSANSDWTKTSKVTFTPAADGESGVIEISISSVKAGYICALEIDTYEDGPGKTPTTLSWSAPTATVDLTSEVKEFPTLTKDPASITGITYTSSNADVATVNEASGEITLVACGQTTIKAAYAGDDTYASSSATYTLRVVDNSIAAGEYTIPLNNWFWATNHNGSFNVEKEKLKLQGQQNGISISLGNVNSTNAYVDDNETRTYSSYIMTVNAPEGYVLKKIEFVGTKWQSSTLNASAGNMGAQKIWSGNVSSVEFYFAGPCEIKNVKIAYEKAAPAKTLTSIAITGEPTKVAYETGESFNPEGLTVTATYDDESTADVTADATWTFDPATFTVVGENIEVAVKAMYKEMEATTTATVSVAKAPLKYFIDLTKDETTTATAEKIEWAKDVVTVSGVQAKGGTAANNYYPGTEGKTYTSTRFYKYSTLTFAPKAGITISSVVYEAATEKYANVMGSSTWTNATVKVEGEKVVITPTDGTTTFSAEIGGTTGGKSFTILYEGTPSSTLAELAKNGTEGKEYTVNDEMVVAKKFQKNGKNYIVVKDAAQAVRNLSAPTADDKFFNINGNKQEKYAQNNWMLVSLPVELYNQLNEKSIVTSITGSLTEKFNVAMEATNVVAGEATEFVPNTYCALNFMGKSSVKGTNPAYTSSYYFATPKANEYAKVVWAVYNGGAFYLPSNNGSINVQGFKAAFNVDYSLNSVDNPKLTSGNVYSFEALVKEVAVPTTDAKSTSDASTKFVVYPLDLDADKVATGVNDVNSAKEVKGVSYFNMMGVESAQPFDGVNIMVTTYTDGTSSAAKVLR